MSPGVRGELQDYLALALRSSLQRQFGLSARSLFLTSPALPAAADPMIALTSEAERLTASATFKIVGHHIR